MLMTADFAIDRERKGVSAPPFDGSAGHDLPVMRTLSKGTLARSLPLRGASVVFVGTHMRPTMLAFAECALAMGAAPGDMIAFEKDYRYREGATIRKALESIGCSVATLGTLEAQLPQFLMSEKQKGNRVLICDDGGYGVRTCMQNPLLCSGVQGAVEQTTRGLWALEHMAKEGLRTPFPVLVLPKSKIKKTFESRTVGELVVDAIERHIGRSIKGLEVAVLGAAGTIGSAVANRAAILEAKVRACDSQPKDPYWALCMHDRFEVVETRAEAISKADIVIGATGNSVLKVQDLPKLKDGCVLASASSGRYEFPVELLDQMSTYSTPITTQGFLEPNATRYQMPWLRSILLLDEGRPVNLGVASGPEDRCFDLIISLLLAGIAELGAGQHAHKVGICDEFDAIMIRHQLADFYRVLHERNLR